MLSGVVEVDVFIAWTKHYCSCDTNAQLTGVEAFVPENRFRLTRDNSRKLRVERVQNEVVFIAASDHAGHFEHGSSSLFEPTVAMGARNRDVVRIPASYAAWSQLLHFSFVGDFHSNHLLILGRPRYVGVNQNFKERAGVGFGSVNDGVARRVPAAAVEHGSRRIENGVAAIRDAVDNQTIRPLDRQAKEEFLEQVFYAARA